MKILYLGPPRAQITDCLQSHRDEVENVEYPLTNESEVLNNKDFMVSYGYQHLLKADVIARFPKKLINLHISLLPWNKGADPNLWSFLEDTPKGVSIHYIDKGIDTGDILAQQELKFSLDQTLRSSYAKLSEAIEQLFFATWPKIRLGQLPAKPQLPGGSFHRTKDKAKFEHLLKHGWDTPIIDLMGVANEAKGGF